MFIGVCSKCARPIHSDTPHRKVEIDAMEGRKKVKVYVFQHMPGETGCPR